MASCFGDAKNEQKTELSSPNTPSIGSVNSGQVQLRVPLTVNGMPLTPDNIVAKREEWKQWLKGLNVSAGEDANILNFSHIQL
ncbi:hypothetical protein [Vibrio sp.]|uniref:hypothetical protein n=1 Tax=Vibrio sp. TaxID=678 RepID=UPI00311F5D7D